MIPESPPPRPAAPLPPRPTPSRYPLDPLVDLLVRLRGPGGCPWDRAQTHASLAPIALEEARELSDAIAGSDPHKVLDELGDLLLQVVFHAVLAMEAGRFGPADVIQALATKLVRRHPHVFGGSPVDTPEDVERLWKAVKTDEAAAGRDAASRGEGLDR